MHFTMDVGESPYSKKCKNGLHSLYQVQAQLRDAVRRFNNITVHDWYYAALAISLRKQQVCPTRLELERCRNNGLQMGLHLEQSVGLLCSDAFGRAMRSVQSSQ